MIEIIEDRIQKIIPRSMRDGKFSSLKAAVDFSNRHEIYAIHRCKNCGYKTHSLLKIFTDNDYYNVKDIKSAIAVYNKYEKAKSLYFRPDHVCSNGVYGVFELIGFEEKESGDGVRTE
jgi:hypothetical protein